MRSAASLISSRGVSATSFSEVLADSGAPRGSIYHHFPDGKAQLTEDAVRWITERVLAYQRSCPGRTARETLSWFIDIWRQTVVRSNAAAGCVVAGVTVDTPAAEESVMELVRASFRSWTTLLAAQLEAASIPPARAATLALAVVAGMEGALILCRAEGSVGPLDAVAEELLRLLPEGRPRRRSRPRQA